MIKTLFVLLAALMIVMNDVKSYNPLLTYTLRIKKVTFTPNISGEITINRYREKYYVSGDFKVDSDLETDNVIIVFNRCKLDSGSDCEYFQTWKFTDVCNKVNQKNQIWSKWYEAYHPPIPCPIFKFHSKIINASLETGPALLLYPEACNYQWKVLQKLYHGDVLVGMYTMYLEYFGYRKRNKSKN